MRLLLSTASSTQNIGDHFLSPLLQQPAEAEAEAHDSHDIYSDDEDEESVDMVVGFMQGTSLGGAAALNDVNVSSPPVTTMSGDASSSGNLPQSQPQPHELAVCDHKSNRLLMSVQSHGYNMSYFGERSFQYAAKSKKELVEVLRLHSKLKLLEDDKEEACAGAGSRHKHTSSVLKGNHDMDNITKEVSSEEVSR